MGTRRARQMDSSTVSVTGDVGPPSAKRRMTRDFEIPARSARVRRDIFWRFISRRSAPITARSKACGSKALTLMSTIMTQKRSMW
nr:MAG TPA: hypothetical protein [Caudoviricetes sp.]DAX80443.1 MAG TPA: hypothetical protein [Caudoviricetes sp.]